MNSSRINKIRLAKNVTLFHHIRNNIYSVLRLFLKEHVSSSSYSSNLKRQFNNPSRKPLNFVRSDAWKTNCLGD